MMTSREIRVADYIQEDCILCGLEAESRDKTIELLVNVLQRKLEGADGVAVVRAVIERERLAPTVLAKGLALPHARLAGIASPVLAMATSHTGIDFEAVGEDPVHVVVLILTPKDDPGAYLRLMASLSRTLNEERIIRRLSVTANAREAYGILTEGPEKMEVRLNAASVMNCNPVTLDESDTMAHAIEAFCANRVMDIPVVDAEGDLRGVIAIEDLLAHSLPQHLLWMEDLSPIENFEPFAELLRKDSETKVADFMHDKYVAIPPEMPAIQLAKIFLIQQIRQIQVVDGSRFLGVISLDSFSSQIFWA